MKKWLIGVFVYSLLISVQTSSQHKNKNCKKSKKQTILETKNVKNIRNKNF